MSLRSLLRLRSPSARLPWPSCQGVLCTTSSKAHFSDSRRPESEYKAPEDSKIDPSRETLFGTVPNVLTMCRMASAPVLSYLIVTQEYRLATAGFVAAGLLDFLDGYIARRFNQHSVLGSFLDPVADKVLIGCVMVTLGSQALLSPALVALIIGRDIGLILGGFVIRARTKPAGVPFFSTTHEASFTITPTTVGKVNMALQLILTGTCLVSLSAGITSSLLVDTLSVACAGSTIWSGWEYWTGSGLKFHSASAVAASVRGKYDAMKQSGADYLKNKSNKE